MFFGFDFIFGDIPKIISCKKNITESFEIIKKPSVDLGD